MSDSAETHTVVYRGLEAKLVDMVENMLETEGLEPRRLGRSDPSSAGVGMYAMEQRLEVPLAHAESARALIAAYKQGASAEEAAALENEAMQTPPVQEPPSKAFAYARPVFFLLFVLGTAALLWLAGLARP